MKISVKLICSYLIVIIVPMSILAIVTTHMINTSMEKSAQEAINQNLKAAWIQYFVRGDQMKYGMLQAASENEIQTAVYQKNEEALLELMKRWKVYRPYVDIWAVVDSEGKVIKRLGNNKSGDYLKLNGLIEKALKHKEAIISTELLPKKVLLENGVTQSLANDEGMVLFVVTPVIMGDEVVGAIITGDLLNGDTFIPHTLENKIPGLKVSIIQEEKVISTNIQGESGQLEFGAKISESILKTISLKERFSGDQKIGDQFYKTAVEPIINNKGEVIGALFVGVPKEHFEILKANNIKAIALVTLLGMLIAFTIAIIAAKEISRPISMLADASRKIREGIFDVKIDSKRFESKDEIGELATSFKDMAVKLKHSYTQLENIVDERTRELLLLQKVNNLLNAGIKLDLILDTIANGLTHDFGYDISAIHLLDEEKNHLICRSYSADSKLVEKVEKLCGKKALGYKIPLFEGSILTKLIKTKKPVITQDIITLVKDHSNKPSLQILARPIVRLSGIKYGIGVPLLAEDKIVGVIGVGSRKKLTEKDLERLLNFARQAGLAVERARIYEILEERVQERTRELKESKEFLDSVFNSITDMIFIRDLEYNIIRTNKVTEQIFGHKIVGNKCYKILMENDSPCNECPAGRTLASGKSFIRETYHDKLKEYLLISTYPIASEDGKLKAVVETVKIVTQKKKMEEQMMQSEKLASIGRLAAGFAHEINNPLTNISLYSQIMRQKARGENKKMLNIIKSQTDIAARIVKNLLEFSYHHPENFVPTQLNEILSRAVDFMTPQFRRKNIKVKLELEDTLLKIRGDESQLQQVFVNMLTNAMDAMENGGCITISTCNNNNSVEIKISDTGHGIPDENLSKIFDPFFTTKEVGEGTGLGLFITYGIIQKHNGTINVKSEIGKGTTFTIQLPALSEHERENTDSR